MRLPACCLLVASIPGLAADPPLASLTPAKVPPAMRPPKGSPPEVLAILSQRGEKIDCLATTPDGKRAAFGGPDAIVRVWDLEKLRLVASQKQPSPVTCLAFGPDGKALAVGDSNGGLRILKSDGGSLTVQTTVAAHKDGPLWGLAFGPDGDRVYSSGADKTAVVWGWANGKLTKGTTLTGHEDRVRSLALSGGGGLLATAGFADGTVRIWESAADKPGLLATLNQPGRVVSVAFAPDGKSLAVGGAKGVPAVWTRDKKKWDRGPALDTHGRAAIGLDYSPDGELIAGLAYQSETEDRAVVWTKGGTKVHEFRYEVHLHAIGFVGDARHLFVVTESEVLLIRLPK